MLKKHLLVSVVALGLSSIALANGSVAPAPVASCPVEEYSPGVYVGLQGGMVDSGIEALEIGGITVDDELGIGGRVFIGYDINKYFAIEAGYMLDGKKTEINVDGVEAAEVRTQAVDLVGKVKGPITDNFGLYAKLGPGYLMQHHDSKNGFSVYNDNTNKIDVVYGAGAYYTFASHWTVDLSWTRYESGHSKLDDDWQSDVDFYALGVSYKFNMPV